MDGAPQNSACLLLEASSAPLSGRLSGCRRSDTWIGRPRCEALDQLLKGVRRTCYNHHSVMRKEAR